MANSIDLVTTFLRLVDAVYKRASVTVELDAVTQDVPFIGADTVKVMKLGTVGLGNYSRTNGYPKGDITATWEALKLTIERAIRKAKREAGALEAAGMDNTAERVRLGHYQAKMRDFLDQTGLVRDRFREQVHGVSVRGVTGANGHSAYYKIDANTDRMQNIGVIGEKIEPFINERSVSRLVRLSESVEKHIYDRHGNQFNIAQAKQKLPKILDDPLFLYEGKKASSVQFVENYSDDYYLMIPVKCLPSELWIETMFIEDKKRFAKRWGKRKLLYERK